VGEKKGVCKGENGKKMGGVGSGGGQKGGAVMLNALVNYRKWGTQQHNVGQRGEACRTALETGVKERRWIPSDC